MYHKTILIMPLFCLLLKYIYQAVMYVYWFIEVAIGFWKCSESVLLFLFFVFITKMSYTIPLAHDKVLCNSYSEIFMYRFLLCCIMGIIIAYLVQTDILSKGIKYALILA